VKDYSRDTTALYVCNIQKVNFMLITLSSTESFSNTNGYEDRWLQRMSLITVIRGKNFKAAINQFCIIHMKSCRATNEGYYILPLKSYIQFSESYMMGEWLIQILLV
jgi:hypothetical protein